MGVLICQSTCVTAGVFITPLRMVTVIFQAFCTLGLIGACVVIAIFRYNAIGNLAALSMAPSRFTETDGVAALSSESTFADDGAMIQRLWITMLVYIIGQCCLGLFANAPPTQDTLREKGVIVNESNIEEEF